MHPRQKIGLCLAIVIGLLSAAPAQEKKSAALSTIPLQTKINQKQLIASLEQKIPALMKEGAIPGLSIAVIRNGDLAWSHGFGVKNAKTNEPVTDTTMFEAASLSKPVFAYAVLKLVDAGKFDLDKPLNQYLPGNYDVGDDPRLGQITARRVLTHTTGFPNWRNSEVGLKIYFTPGDRFSYSGEGFVYLSKVIEQVTGEKFNDFMKRTVFEPLGMINSGYVWEDRFESLMTFRHNGAGEPRGQNKGNQPNAAASLRTTAQDFGRFLTAILQGTGLKKETRELMLTPQIKVSESGTNNTLRTPEKLSPTLSWGLGWGLETTPDGVAFWHWGDNGDSKAFIEVYDKQKIGVVYFANSSTGLSIAPDLINAALGGSQPALAWLKYEGYRSPGRTFLNAIVSKGAASAIADYRVWRKDRPAAEQINENRMNQIGYDLLGMKRYPDAIEVMKLNVEDYPQSANAYDSLGEAYMNNGDKDLAIKNYRRSIELNPGNKNGAEMLKKLEAEK